MIPRGQFDKGSRVLVKLFGDELLDGVVERGYEWIDRRTGAHKRRRIVVLDKPIKGFEHSPDLGRRWNFELSELRSPDKANKASESQS